jgi:hypothetical protein
VTSGDERAALIRAAGSELTGLAYLILQHRGAAEAAGATALAAAVRRTESTGWRPAGAELRARLVADTIAAALRGYGQTREVDPLAAARPTMLPAQPLARAVVAAVLVAGLPLPAAARAVGIGEGRARRLMRDAVAAAGSEDRLREAMAAQVRAPASPVTPPEVVDAGMTPPETARRRTPAVLRAAVAGAALGIVLLGLATAPRSEPAAEAPSGSHRAASRAPDPAVAAEVGVLPTLASCGIGPPDARLAYAGWLTVEELGAAPPDAAPAQPFYALVPAGDVAWNPPGLSRRIMPPVRGRLACLSTVSGAAPTIVGLPAGWEPPATRGQPLPTRADCDFADELRVSRLRVSRLGISCRS